MNILTENIEKEVLRFVNKAEPGSIIFSEDFKYLHKPDAVNTALHRAAKLKKLWRISKGIYMKPKKGSVVRKVYPKAEEVVNAIAKRDRIRLLPSGSYALYVLGLTSQIPTNIVYLTDSAPRKFNVGSRKVQFKRTTPKMLAMRGKVSSLVIQAFKEIGKENVTKFEESRIAELLKKEDEETLEHDLNLAPRWIGEIIADILD